MARKKSDETRLALRRACIENNIAVLTSATSVEQIELRHIVDTRAILERYDRGEPIGG